jgi:predicted dehydrogenase
LALRHEEKAEAYSGKILLAQLRTGSHSMNADKTRWGILGTADIARKNWLAIRNSGNGIVRAVAGRDLKRARQFVSHCQANAPFPELPQVFASYEELLACKEIDAVYLPLPTGLRKEWVLRAAEAGKHVVCEKPCASNLADLEEMLSACQRHQVQFMDGVMFMHSLRLARLRQVLDDQTAVGPIRRITSAFTFCASDEFFVSNIRAHPGLEPQGCLGDLGWYCIRFSLWAMRWQMPQRVVGRILAQRQSPQAQGSVLSEFSGELFFHEGISAGFFCSFLTQNQEWAVVSGTNGYIRLEDFVVPFSGDQVSFELHNHQYLKSGCEFKMAKNVNPYVVAEHSQAHPSAQESNLFREFSHQIRSGRLSEDWPAIALKTQTVMQACLESARNGSSERSLQSSSSTGFTAHSG